MKDSTKIRLIKILIALLVVILFIIVEAFTFEPTRLKVSYRSITSNDVPSSFEDFSICFFTDLHYGTTYNAGNIEEVMDKINLLQPDIILFGGDLVDTLEGNDVDMATLVSALSTLEAKYGKFAVLGNHDYESKSTEETVTRTLELAGFTIITNTSTRIHNGTIDSIRLAGLDSMSLGMPNTSTTFEDVRSSDFTVLLTHTPDNILNVPNNMVDLELAGHSHGSQIYLPLISSLMTVPGAHTYWRGTYKTNGGAIVYVSNGVGTTHVRARLFSNPEIVVYRLHHAS